MSRSFLGLDIGGANLKAAHNSGAVRSHPFALWENPAGLADALRDLIAELPPADALAVTMTGELCDCYESKRQGVHAILDAVEQAAGLLPIRVWRTDGRFTDVAAARKDYLKTAAANWLALATYVGRFAPKGPALLIDIGSTTTDIIPLNDGKPIPNGRTDPQRLRSSELLYTGVRRTPLCSVGAEVAELFATTLDVYLITGAIPEDPNDRNTADGRPATRAAAHARIARMLCADLETSTDEDRMGLVYKVVLRQDVDVASAVELVAKRLPGPPEKVILAGEGAFLARSSLERQRQFPPCGVVDLLKKFGRETAQAACAMAVAALAQEAER